MTTIAMNLKISEKLAQPQVNHYISWLRRAEYIHLDPALYFFQFAIGILEAAASHDFLRYPMGLRKMQIAGNAFKRMFQ